jgi:hypothetical protein
VRATQLSRVCLGLAGYYGLLAGDLSVHEVVAGAIACVGAFGFQWVVRRSAPPGPRVSLSAAECARVFLSLATESVMVAQVLIRVIRYHPVGAVGSLRRLAMDGNREGSTQIDPTAAGWRAALTLAKSIAPNEFVVDIDDRVCVMHRLADTQ